MKKSFLCIDFLNILYRSFYALPSMRNSKGIHTGGIYGFIKIFKKIISEYKIDNVIICSDGQNTIKKKKYTFYKAHRDKTPNELIQQKDALMQYFENIKVPVIFLDNYEADDIIWNIAIKYSEKEYINMYILSSDKDLYPLLFYKNVKIIDTNKNTLLDKEKLIEKYKNTNLTKQKLLFYRTLCGDASDNIPGVKGIGEKTALKIISQYSSLDEIYNSINIKKEIISKKITNLFLDNKEKAYQSEFLIQPLEISNKSSIYDIIENQSSLLKSDFSLGHDFLLQHECPSLIQEKRNYVNQERENLPYAKHTFTVKKAITEEEIATLKKNIEGTLSIAIDTETTSGDPRKTEIIGFSIAIEKDEAWYIPLMYQGKQMELYQEKVNLLKAINKDATVIMHNALFDMHVLNLINIRFKSKIFDTMIAAFVTKEKKIGLKELSAKLLNQKMDSFSYVISQNNYKSFDQINLDTAAEYAATDARQTFLLYQHFTNLLNKKEYDSTKNLLFSVEMPLIEVLYHIESSGILCDKNILIKEEEKYLIMINTIHKKIRKIAASYDFNLNPMSNKQTSQFLYSILGLNPDSKKKSTDQTTLSNMKELHPIISLIILYRSLQSNISHFTKGLLKYIEENGRIYTHYQQFVTTTGRITTINPNLQNLPVVGDTFKIRNAFYAKENFLLASFDYSQIEIRILAWLSSDPTLSRLLKNNDDIHIKTASRIFNKDEEQITKEERQIAKKVNFSVIYGQGAYNLSRELKISREKAKKYLEIFENTYPQIFTWMDSIIEKAKVHGYVATHYGLKRYIPELQETNKTVFKSGVRMAINTIIQGTAAEIMKKSMRLVYEYLTKKNIGNIVLQIHDEIIIEIEKKNIDNNTDKIKKIMELVEKDIHLQVNTKIGKRWN